MTSTDLAAPYFLEPLGVDGVARIRYSAGTVLTEAVARRLYEAEHAGRDRTIPAGGPPVGLAVA